MATPVEPSRQPGWYPRRGPPKSIADLAVDPTFLFRHIHPFRALARAIVSSAVFEAVVLVAIFVNLGCMMMEDISAQRAAVPSKVNDNIDQLDFATLVIFSVEFLLKVLAVGLCPLPEAAPSWLRPDPVWRPSELPRKAGRSRSITAALTQMLGGTHHATAGPGVTSMARCAPGTPGAADGAVKPPDPGVGGADHASLHRVRSGVSVASVAAVNDPDDFASGLSTTVQRMLDEKNTNLLLESFSSEQAEYYFRSAWNRLDFCMLVIAFVGQTSSASNSGLSALRALRTLRPLRAVRFFAPLQSILHSLWQSARGLVNVMVCLSFFFVLFSLMGQQFFQGSLQRRCVVPAGSDARRFDLNAPGFPAEWQRLQASADAAPTQYTVYHPETWCSLESDPHTFVCGDLNVRRWVDVPDVGGGSTAVEVPLVCTNIQQNPSFGLVNFDDLGGSLYCVFMISSLQVHFVLSPGLCRPCSVLIAGCGLPRIVDVFVLQLLFFGLV
jgi:hypothetical protein